MTQSKQGPTLPDIPNMGEAGRKTDGGPNEGPVMPLSVTDRVTQVRNNMYENYLRQSNKQLQDEIQHTMRAHSMEKHQLLQQLASLRHDMGDFRRPDTNIQKPDMTRTHRKYVGHHSDATAYHKKKQKKICHERKAEANEPNTAIEEASSQNEKLNLPIIPLEKEKYVLNKKSATVKTKMDDHENGKTKMKNVAEEKLSVKSCMSDETDREKNHESIQQKIGKTTEEKRSTRKGKMMTHILIQDGGKTLTEDVLTSKKTSTHKSGRSLKTKMSRTQPLTDEKTAMSLTLPPISLLSKPQWTSGDHSPLSDNSSSSSFLDSLPQIGNSDNILTARDNQTNEMQLPTEKKKKKVHFQRQNVIHSYVRSDYYPQSQHGTSDSPRRDNPTKIRSTKRRTRQNGIKGRRTTTLPLIGRDENSTQFQNLESEHDKKLHDAADWKALYVNIHDPEKRTKTLADILHAVRFRMRVNEQNLKYGEVPRQDKTDNTLCDYLLTHNQDNETDRNPGPETKQRMKTLVPGHTAERLHRRSNAVQLQNYLHKLSRQRRMIEHMAGEEYRLAHIVGHKQLGEAVQRTS